jgi:rhodanese-related sulfurtransferase
MPMMWSLAATSIALVCVTILAVRRTRVQDQLQHHSITAAELHALLVSGQKVRVFDVRQPLDLLAHLEIIPGAQRIPPNEVLENPNVIPENEPAVVYCTCPSDKTSRQILRRALARGLSRVKFLRGGLAGWKENGYPVEPYEEVFHLYDANVAKHST